MAGRLTWGGLRRAGLGALLVVLALSVALASAGASRAAQGCATPPVIATQPTDQTTQPPAAVTFTVAEGAVAAGCTPAAFQWQVSTDGGLTYNDIAGASTNTLTIAPTSTSLSGNEYRAVLVNAGGSTASTPATLTASGICTTPPTVATQPADVTVPAPSPASFTVSESPIPGGLCAAATIQWQVSSDGGTTFADIAGATAATLKISPTATALSENEYRAVLTNQAGSTNSTPATLTVTQTCTYTVSGPNDVTVTAPDPATFTVTITTQPGCALPAVQWQLSIDGGATFTNASGATGDTLTIDPTSVSQSGEQFRAALTNAAGSASTRAARLTVLPMSGTCSQPPSIATQPQNASAGAAGGSASFTVAEGPVPPGCSVATIQWQVSSDGGTMFTNIAGASSATLTIDPVTAALLGNLYRAVLTNAAGSTVSSEAKFSGPPPCTGPPTVAIQPTSASALIPSQSSASFVVAEGVVPAGCGAATIQWQASADGGATFTSVTGATSATLTITPLSTSLSGNEYRAILTNESGSTTSAAATLTVEIGECTSAPTIATQPSSVAVIAPSAAVFAVAEGTVPPRPCAPATIQWQVSTDGGAVFSNIAGATSDTLTIARRRAR